MAKLIVTCRDSDGKTAIGIFDPLKTIPEVAEATVAGTLVGCPSITRTRKEYLNGPRIKTTMHVLDDGQAVKSADDGSVETKTADHVGMHYFKTIWMLGLHVSEENTLARNGIRMVDDLVKTAEQGALRHLNGMGHAMCRNILHAIYRETGKNFFEKNGHLCKHIAESSGQCLICPTGDLLSVDFRAKCKKTDSCPFKGSFCSLDLDIPTRHAIEALAAEDPEYKNAEDPMLQALLDVARAGLLGPRLNVGRRKVLEICRKLYEVTGEDCFQANGLCCRESNGAGWCLAQHKTCPGKANCSFFEGNYG